MDIAIIGFGTSGVSVLRQLTNHKEKLNIKKIYIIQDKKDQFAKGLPYQKDHESLILNVFPKFMSMNPKDKHEFEHYLDQQGISFEADDYLPRRIFGDYSQSLYEELLENNNEIEIVNQEVIKIEIEDKQYRLIYKNTESILVDSVQLTLGHVAYNDPYQLKHCDQFIYNPYPVEEKLSNLQANQNVAIIGTGLSALDIMTYLKRDNESRPVDMFSLEGLARTVRGHNYQDKINLEYLSSEQLAAFADQLDRPLTADDIMNQFKKEVTEHGVDFDYFWNERVNDTIESLEKDFEQISDLNTLQTIIMAFKNNLNPLWDRLSEEEKGLYMKKYNGKITLYGAPIPAKRAKEIIDYTKEGTLRIVGGAEDIKWIDEGNSFSIKANSNVYDRYDYIINATGQNVVIKKQMDEQSTLVKQLVNDRIAEPYDFGGFKVDYPTYSLIHPDKGILPTFKVYGQLSSGIDLYNNSIAKLTASTKLGIEEMVKWYSEQQFYKG